MGGEHGGGGGGGSSGGDGVVAGTTHPGEVRHALEISLRLRVDPVAVLHARSLPDLAALFSDGDVAALRKADSKHS